MELQLRQVLDILQVLELLTPQPELRISAAFAFRRLKKDFAGELDLFEELRQELLDKHSKKDDDGNPIITENHYLLVDEGVPFAADIDELLNQPREVTFNTLPAAALGNVTISIQALDKLIECGMIDDGEHQAS